MLKEFRAFAVKGNMNRLMEQRKEAAKEGEPPAPTTQEVLLTEIRDLLESQSAA